MIAPPTIRILRFTSDTCGACAAQKKLQTIEKFISGLDRPASTRLVELICLNKDNDAPVGTPYRKAYELSETYKVERFPTVVVEMKLDGGSAVELFRTEGGVTLAQLKKLHSESSGEIVKGALPWE